MAPRREYKLTDKNIPRKGAHIEEHLAAARLRAAARELIETTGLAAARRLVEPF